MHQIENILFKLIFYFSPIVGIGGIIVPYLLGLSNLSIIGIYLAIPLCVSPMIYYIYESKNEKELKNYDPLYFNISFYILFSFSILVLYYNPIRPWFYYLIMAILCSIIMAKIFYTDCKNNFNIYSILFQIILFTINLISSVSLNYFYYLSRSDTVVHVWFINSINEFGSSVDIRLSRCTKMVIEHKYYKHNSQ